jgi:hypothetical protein
LWKTVWFFIKIWSNEKRRNWRFSIHGIYPETAISHVKIGMVSKPEKEGPGLISLRIYAKLSGIFTLYEKGWAGSLSTSCNPHF